MFILERFSKTFLYPFLLSLFFHVFVFLALYAGFVHFRPLELIQSPTKPSTEALPEVVLDLSPPPSEKRSVIQTTSEHPLEEAPKDAAFESHENTEAASELPATGTEPLPTQEGEESDFLELKKRNQQIVPNHVLLQQQKEKRAAKPIPHHPRYYLLQRH